MNRLIKLCLFFIILITSFKVSAQTCTGDACGVVLETTIPNSNSLKYTNTSPNRSVKVGMRPAMFGSPPGNKVYYNLSPGSSINLGGAYVRPYEATFTSPPPPHPIPPAVPTRNAKFDNGYYRIKNVSTGAYIHLQRGSEHIQPDYHFVVCDQDLTAESEDAKWILTVKTKVPITAGNNEEETYQLANKAAPSFYFSSYNVDATHLIAIAEQHPQDFMQWEIAIVPGTNYYQIRGKNEGYSFVLSSVHPKTIEYTQVLGTPDKSLWILEKL